MAEKQPTMWVLNLLNSDILYFLCSRSSKQKISIQNGPIQSFGKVSKTEQSATQSYKSLNGKSTAHISACTEIWNSMIKYLDMWLFCSENFMSTLDIQKSWSGQSENDVWWFVGMKLHHFSDLKTCWDIKSDKTHHCSIAAVRPSKIKTY